jgi:glutamyl-tRNA synthetase
VPLVRERLKTLADVVGWTDFFFARELEYDATLLVGKKMTAAQCLAALRQMHQALQTLPDLETETTEPRLRQLADDLGLKAGQLFGILRVAITGKTVAPPLLETIAILGRETTLARVRDAVHALEPLAS